MIKTNRVNTSEIGWKLYTNSEDGWEAMLDACENAKKSIDLEQFIFIRNEIGEKFIDICSKKVKKGVKVRFLWDAVGSFSFFGSSTIEELKSKGIELIFYKTLFPSFYEVHNYKSWYLRNHRRTLVIDGVIGFTGSICVSDEMKYWRDTVVKIDGEAVNEMQDAFQKMWYEAQKKDTPIEQSDRTYNKSIEFKYITNSPIPGKRYLYNTVLKAIRDANEYVYITTPYFVPTRQLYKLLRKISRSGVRVKIIIPESTDHPIVDLCARTFFNKMLKDGIKIYLYKDKIVHSKTIIIDNKWSSVGTLNLDTISLLYNFEGNLVSTNTDFADELLTHFIDDLHKTKEITFSEWKSRYWIEKFTGFFVRFVRDFL